MAHHETPPNSKPTLDIIYDASDRFGSLSIPVSAGLDGYVSISAAELRIALDQIGGPDETAMLHLRLLNVADTDQLGAPGPSEPQLYTFADDRILINNDDRKAYADGKLLNLAYKEFNILTLLAQNADRVVTHQFLQMTVWGYIMKPKQAFTVSST